MTSPPKNRFDFSQWQTRQLLEWRYNNDFSESEQTAFWLELNSREHIPNKIEAYLSRKQKRKQKKQMQYQNCVSHTEREYERVGSSVRDETGWHKEHKDARRAKFERKI